MAQRTTVIDDRGLLNPRGCLLSGWPRWILGEARAVRTACHVKIAHHHVVEQHVMQSTSAEPPADEMDMDIEARHFAESLLELECED